MKQFNEFKNQLPYPQAQSFLTERWFKNGVLVARRQARAAIQMQTDLQLTVLDLKRCDLEIETDKVGFRAAMAVYSAESARLNEGFKAEAFAELGLTGNPRADVLFEKAWELGHHSHSHAFNWMFDLADLIR